MRFQPWFRSVSLGAVISGLLIALNLGIFIVAVVVLFQCYPYRRLPVIKHLTVLMIAFCLCSFFVFNVYANTSFETKVTMSRLRFLGFAFASPSALLFCSFLLGKWRWLHNRYVQIAMYVPGTITSLVTLGVLNQNLMVHSFQPLTYWDVSVVSFETGPWFAVHYTWSNLCTLGVLMLLGSAAIKSRGAEQVQILILSIGALVSTGIDLYCVVTGSPMRWLMLSAGTFILSEAAILYVLHRYEFFGLIPRRSKIQENMELQENFLKLVAHDLSGNLTQTEKLSRYLQDQPLGSHVETLNTLANSASASKELLANMISWMKTQNLQIQVKKIEVNKFLQECIDRTKALHNKSVEFEVKATKNPLMVSCDPEMLSSIFRNLLSNAVNASSENKRVVIHVKDLAACTQFIIEDEGVGMTAEQLESLWTSKSYKAPGPGYGIGLKLVRHLVELHNGDIKIESTPQEGTRVYLSLPL